MLRKLGNLERIRSERFLTVEELSKASGVPRSTIVGLEEGTRKAQEVTVDRLAEALGVEPGELANEEGITILEEREGDRVRVVRQYDDCTLEMSYDTTRLSDAYRFILERVSTRSSSVSPSLASTSSTRPAANSKASRTDSRSRRG